MSLYYVADLHLCHPMLRDWVPPEIEADYENLIITKWNQSVSDEDVVVVVGDVGIDSPDTFKILSQLCGTKILVRGNHDMEWSKNTQLFQCFYKVVDELSDDSMLIVHNPMDAIERATDKWFIHGHLHTIQAMQLAGIYNQYRSTPTWFNVALPLLEWAPRTLTYIQFLKELQP